MRQMQNELKKKDIENYEVVIPFFDVAGKRRKQFLSSELEKLHPCFSDEFAFDSGIKKISKKGMLADVLVVNKYKLAEYEQRRKFSGRGFFLERDSPAGRHRAWQKRFFVSSKWKLTYFSLAACLLVAICGLIFGAFSGRWIFGPEANVEESETGAGSTARATSSAWSESEGINPSDGAEASDKLSLSEVFFDCVSASEGTISLFEWNVQGFTEKLSASLSGLFPENLERVRKVSGLMQNERMSDGNPSAGKTDSSAVIYERQVPRMKVSYNRKLLQMSSSSLSPEAGLNSRLSNSDFNKNLRELITVHGGILQEENAPPYHIEFTCLAKADESKKIFEEIAALVREEERQITSVFVSQRFDEKKRTELRIGLSIEEIPLAGFDLNLISKNISLFRESSKNDMKQQGSNSLKKDRAGFGSGAGSSGGQRYSGEKSGGKNGAISGAVSGEKIGEIKKSDNSTLVFFKTPEGKIQTKIIPE